MVEPMPLPNETVTSLAMALVLHAIDVRDSSKRMRVMAHVVAQAAAARPSDP